MSNEALKINPYRKDSTKENPNLFGSKQPANEPEFKLPEAVAKEFEMAPGYAAGVYVINGISVDMRKITPEIANQLTEEVKPGKQVFSGLLKKTKKPPTNP